MDHNRQQESAAILPRPDEIDIAADTDKGKTPTVVRKIDSGFNSYIPDAMPLIMRISHHNWKEPEQATHKLRRGVTINLGGADSVEDEGPKCLHDGEVKNWTCMLCKGAMPKFNIIFDNNEGSL